jgi:hypothetical protein
MTDPLHPRTPCRTVGEAILSSLFFALLVAACFVL